MEIKSLDFESGSNIPARFTCDGEGARPELKIEGAPIEAQSLALIVEDPDSPVGIFTHWILWNIPADAGSIAPDKLPDGSAEGTSDFGKIGYGGPCPNKGIHHYRFRLYALSAKLDLPATSSRTDLLLAMEGKVLAESELTGLYERRVR